MTLFDRDIGVDVRELGALVGETIERQASRETFGLVEELRTESIAYRRGEADSREPVQRAIADASVADAETVARAFSAYFELINLAEERRRVRELRRRRQAGELGDSAAAAVATLAEQDAPPATVQRVLDDVLVEPTFTAHPTEPRRKTVKAKLRHIASTLQALDERRLTDEERAHLERDLEAAVRTLWQTPQLRERRPAVTDEALNVQWYLENVLFDVVAEVYEALEAALAETYPEVSVPKLFEFRSWAGSDRDGNPYVTPGVTAETLERQRSVVLGRYREACKRLSGVVSHDADRIEVGDPVADRLATHEAALGSVAEAATTRYPNEPYRQLLKLVRERLDRVGDVRPGGYDGPEGLATDLRVLAADLRANGCETVAAAEVDPLVRTVETFGFAMAPLDLRDHRAAHTAAVGAALDREGVDYAAMPEAERVRTLTDAVLQDPPVVDVTDTAGLDEETTRVLDRFAALADWQREYGVDAIDTYCISMFEAPSHVLEVLFLADQAGVVDLPEHCGLDIVPLLETEAALSRAREIMGTLFENDAYAAALAARGDTQEVMLGYSDSCKENGYLAAQWALDRTQRRLARVTDDHDVKLRLFHGRGGSISRGGGPMNEALLALPPETVTGEVKFTEQGEAIAEKYANPRIARRELEQMLNAQLRARHAALTGGEPDLPAAWVAAMETACEAARDAYRDLLETEGFVRFFEQATPITVIEDLNLGSRPASRSGERTIEDLRAIPWVFAWTQARCIVPGWYSLAAGLDAYLDDGGDLETLREMYDGWRFFEGTIDNAAVALARSDMEIGALYAELADEDLRERFAPRIQAEYDRAVELVLSISGRDRLPRADWFAESLARRNPYVDPLNLLQIRLLGTTARSDREERTLRLTVKGIAAGMKSTG